MTKGRDGYACGQATHFYLVWSHLLVNFTEESPRINFISLERVLLRHS